jgi:hypothetical protein
VIRAMLESRSNIALNLNPAWSLRAKEVAKEDDGQKSERGCVTPNVPLGRPPVGCFAVSIDCSPYITLLP